MHYFRFAVFCFFSLSLIVCTITVVALIIAFSFLFDNCSLLLRYDSQAMDTSGLHGSPNPAPQMFPPIYPSVTESVQNQEQLGYGQGLYAVQFSPFMGMMHESPPNMLIPLTYKIPT